VFFDRILPSNVSPILETYFSTSHRSPQTAGALVSAAVVSLTGAASVMATLMEGFRRAHDLPLLRGSFWPRRIRALWLVPLSLVPMALASLLVVFGHLLTGWVVATVTPSLRAPVYVLAFLLRWAIALAGSVGIIAVIYHLGTDLSKQMRHHLEPLLREPWMALRKDWSWRASLPGATVATVLWFVSTLLFGLYVTRFANYSRVYGSLGAAIALMVWLYIIALSVLVGAEFNAQRAVQGPERRDPEMAALLWKIPGLHFRRTGRISD
jgi:membrane protein